MRFFKLHVVSRSFSIEIKESQDLSNAPRALVERLMDYDNDDNNNNNNNDNSNHMMTANKTIWRNSGTRFQDFFQGA